MQGKQNIIYQYIVWYFFDVPKEILRGWRNYILFYSNYFSVPTLLKTFFSHWRRYYSSYGKGFSIARYSEAFVFNMMSRIIGAILRVFFIVAGVLAEILIFILGVIIFLAWFLLPLVLISGLIFSIRLMVF